MTERFLCRLRLRRDASLSALAPLLMPVDETRHAAGHRLIWSLFADGPERRRDFLWREEAPGKFMVLSSRAPNDLHGLFEVEYQPFVAVLAPGDRLAFTLRVNPVVARSPGPGRRGRRHDVVMDALHALPAGARGPARAAAILDAGRAWFARQGASHGFSPVGDPAVDGYDRIVVSRGAGRKPAVFGVMDVSGLLQVDDPTRFATALAAGFGKARAFGNGLMLVRRAGLRSRAIA